MINQHEYQKAILEMAGAKDEAMISANVMDKIDKTLKLLFEYAAKAGRLLFVDGKIKLMAWYAFWKWIPLGKLMYDLICELFAIWGKKIVTNE